MDDIVTANDVLEIACEIEENGEVFYRKAAQRIGDDRAKKVLTDLAEMEVTHQELFRKLQKTLDENKKDRGELSRDKPVSEHIRAFAAGHIFDLKADHTSLLNREVISITEILDKAIDLEKDTVIFYLGFRDVLTSELGEDYLTRVINEEMSHIYLLSDYLEAL